MAEKAEIHVFERDEAPEGWGVWHFTCLLCDKLLIIVAAVGCLPNKPLLCQSHEYLMAEND